MSSSKRPLKVLHEVRKRHITQRLEQLRVGISVRWVRTLLERLRCRGRGTAGIDWRGRRYRTTKRPKS
jgi:hypothetical protein